MKLLSAIIAGVIVLLAANSMYVVREAQTALLLQFGRITDTDSSPGLHFKLPIVQQVEKFDSRILNLDAQPERYFTSEKKSVDVDFYVKWRIADTPKYYRATSGILDQARVRLSPIVKDALRFEINAQTLDELISGGRKDITESVRKLSDAATRKNLGIAVIDVRIKRIELPSEVSDSIYNRMRAERKKLANELRSTGNEAAETIRADADRQRQVLIADAQREATETRGQGDAQAAQIYAKAYGQDPKFFDFYRSMSAYRKAFADGRSIFVIKPDSQFLHYFKEGPAP